MRASRQSQASFAITVAVGAAAYLHVARGGTDMLLSWPAAAFVAAAALVAPFTLGLLAYGLHRLLVYWSGSDPTRLRQAAVAAQAVLVGEVVGGYYLVKAVFGWVYGQG